MRRATGFSLLELLIVLAVMAGLAAIVFPSLTRPLAESDVARAAALLRDTIADCRNKAMTQQQLRLLRFEAECESVSSGDWQSLVVDDQHSHSGNEDLIPTDLRLPDGIVVERVIWSDGDEDTLSESSDLIATETECWYLPCLPTGKSKDCQIVLRDRVSGARSAVCVDGVLNMMRVERLPPTGNADNGGPLP